QRKKEMEEKKVRDAEAKKRRLEEAEKKRHAMQAAKEKQKVMSKPNFVITRREEGDRGPGASLGMSASDKFSNVLAARGEMGKTKEEMADDKRMALGFRVKPLETEGMDLATLKSEVTKLWERVVMLETEKYDLEVMSNRQDYDLKELAERERQINRSRALKKGLDPEALTGRFPPKLQTASKYERRIDRRSYDDKKGLFDGGLEADEEAKLESKWESKMTDHKEKGPPKLLKWDPEAIKAEAQKKRDARQHRSYVDTEDDDEEYVPPPKTPSPEPVRKAPPPKKVV
ncbi:TNNT2 (predicted), partial [Pycnogonum litorale]